MTGFVPLRILEILERQETRQENLYCSYWTELWLLLWSDWLYLVLLLLPPGDVMTVVVVLGLTISASH